MSISGIPESSEAGEPESLESPWLCNLMNATVSPNAARWQRDLKSDDSEKRFGRLEGIVPGESKAPVRFFSLDEPWTDRGPARNVFFLLSLTAVRSRQRTTSVCLNFGGQKDVANAGRRSCFHSRPLLGQGSFFNGSMGFSLAASISTRWLHRSHKEDWRATRA